MVWGVISGVSARDCLPPCGGGTGRGIAPPVRSVRHPPARSVSPPSEGGAGPVGPVARIERSEIRPPPVDMAKPPRISPALDGGCGPARHRLAAPSPTLPRTPSRGEPSDLSRRFETIVIEDLNVSGMAKNHSLAGAVLDCGFHEIRWQFRYKQAMRGGRVVLADRFYPSTQICWCCGCLTGPTGREEMHVEEWICSECGAAHTRDGNPVIDLRKLGTAGAESTRGGHDTSTGILTDVGKCRG
jgi:Putative transposase DNA-binding domain